MKNREPCSQDAAAKYSNRDRRRMCIRMKSSGWRTCVGEAATEAARGELHRSASGAGIFHLKDFHEPLWESRRSGGACAIFTAVAGSGGTASQLLREETGNPVSEEVPVRTALAPQGLTVHEARYALRGSILWHCDRRDYAIGTPRRDNDICKLLILHCGVGACAFVPRE